MKWYHFFIVFFQGFLFSIILTPIMKWMASVLGFLDHPGERKVHMQPKPLLGGAAIYLSIVLVVGLDLYILDWIFNNDLAGTHWLKKELNVLALWAAGAVHIKEQLLGLWAGGTVLFIIGLIDDRCGMNPLIKLIGQMIAAIILYAANIQIALFINQPIINFLLTMGWIVLITNSFNLLDNMDGLSGGVAMIALILLGISTHLVSQQVFMSAISFALAGSIAGFLRYNIHPSKIFMGDAGSLFVGYSVATLTVMSTFYLSGTENAVSWSVVMPVVILAVPIFDTLSVIFIRIKNGKPIYLGDKNHFSHRLVALGMSHRRAVFFIHLVTLCVGSAALVLPVIYEPFGAYVVLTQTILFFMIIVMLENIKNHSSHSSDKRK
ncbi:MAG: undecaprenyl/decaprenyl-phosphate alpha-N-acetylglucosaminyl 1-phosphate transferase [Candidatus Omnitrophota bacterium]|jgi:UDP-GlcNAc:undecaprenyl-phosphate GlcNAc-1-phosphate transferase|nr:MAG: undecaprenyl/decaprenyl-phosphate alpha-N-acetylglucosaminyl 1-phosphate transferase [Candidatus Omnitrophota bacterium]